jgi:hypothetical protein
MPRGDRTGPQGLGPMTGRGAGYCAGYPLAGYANPVSGRGFGYGRGLGRGGFGRGFKRGFGWARYPYTYANQPLVPAQPDSLSPKQEADMLKAEAKAMQAEIETINQRLKDIESGNLSENNE